MAEVKIITRSTKGIKSTIHYGDNKTIVGRFDLTSKFESDYILFNDKSLLETSVLESIISVAISITNLNITLYEEVEYNTDWFDRCIPIKIDNKSHLLTWVN